MQWIRALFYKGVLRHYTDKKISVALLTSHSHVICGFGHHKQSNIYWRYVRHGSSPQFATDLCPLYLFQCAAMVLLHVRPAWFLTTVSTLCVATVPVCFIGIVTCEACMVPHNSFHSTCCYSTSVLHWCCYL